MTSNQIEFAKHKETQRANRAKETETARHNIATEQLQTQSNRLTEEHYGRQDSINALAQQESVRSNLAREGETHRHNVASEQLGFIQAGLQSQSILETSRHNAAVESLTSEENRIAAVNANNKFITETSNASANMIRAEAESKKADITKSRTKVQNLTDIANTVMQGIRLPSEIGVNVSKMYQSTAGSLINSFSRIGGLLK